jgi:dihydrofolate reductase
MRRICYSVAMSLDGYTAGPKGEADWIVGDPEIDFAAMFARFDTLLMGRRTFELTQSPGAPTMPGVAVVVVSRTLRPENYPKVTVLSVDLEDGLARLRAQPGKDLWLFGGSTLFRSLLEIGQVDTIEVAVIPVLLGEGLPLLPAPSPRSKLRLVGSKVYKASGIVSLQYAVERKPPS